MAVRVKDIADRAEVSPATVSLVLNGKPGVGDETRDRILKIAKELGYRGPKPQRSGASASGAAGETVLFLHIARHGHTVNRDHDVFIADYIEGLGQCAKQQRLKLEILTFKTTPIESVIDMARERPAAGYVVLGTELDESDVEAFGRLAAPVVFIDTYHDFMPFDFVDMNNEDSVYTIVSSLAARGHRRIGMVKGSIETRNFRLREEGFQASLARLGLAYDARCCFAVDPTFHGAYEDMSRLLACRPELPTALFCANDVIACGCLRALTEAGVRVPADISLVGFDDLPLSAVVEPPLTTIQVSKAHIGRMAIEQLAARIRSAAEMPPVKILVGGRLVERSSVRDIAS